MKESRENHCLKITKKNFESVQDGSMSFQLRRDDRNFSKGDVVYLKEIDEDNCLTGRKQAAIISYVLRDGEGTSGIKKGYALLNLSLRSLIVRDGMPFRTTIREYSYEKCK